MDEMRQNLITRLKKIEGQVRGVQRMIEEEADCGEILNQIAAIKSAVSSVGILIFENHAHECIYQAVQEENKEDSFKEVIKLLSKLIK
ncbi:metal-sensitive transcriptional regulator [Thermosyntropha sp.]|uniref:metal-sensitive transcriptional regulator n=1 Tax=Thermosyntropha sp. TaxID=2740820 RepID=UPI0025EBB7F3|nr:metal-sensitive transcriptional regulator [Thermosyntropha sp.]MBO8159821.1 metal-sensitive transcriptional regulator [Thermosyntropha sp.]